MEPQVSGTPESMLRSFVFKNVGTTEIPGYGCMMVVDAEGNIGKGIGAEIESNRTVVYCKQPDSEAASRQDPNLMAFNSRNSVKPNKYGRCVIGQYPAKALGVSTSSIGRLKVVADSYSLESTSDASAAFVSVGSPDQAQRLSYVMASTSRLNLVRFALTANLAANGSAPAIQLGSGGQPLIVTDVAGNAGASGDRGIAWKDGDTYWVVEIKSRGGEPIVRFTLDEDIDDTSRLAGATINSFGPDNGTTIEVEDWCENGGKEGDKGVAWKTTNTAGDDVYYVVEIKRSADPQIVRFTLTEDLANTRGAEADANIEGAIVGSPTTGTVINWDRHWARSGARGLAWKYEISDEVTYHVISVEPVATSIRGRVVTTFNCSSSFVTLDEIKGIGGDAPPGSSIEVRNFGFAANTGAAARADWNQTDGQWELTWVPVTPVISIHVSGGELRYNTICAENIKVADVTSSCP